MAALIERLTQAATETLGLDKQQQIGIGSFNMYAMLSRQYTLKSTIPKGHTEDGATQSDHVTLESIPVTVTGVVSDIYLRRNPVVEAYLRNQAEIGSVAKYAPLRTQSQLSQLNGIAVDAANQVRRVDTAIADGRQALEYFGDKSGSKSLREQFVTEMDRLHYSKALVSIELPYTVLEDMRITSCVIEDDNGAEEIGFTITAEQFRKSRLLFDDVSGFYKNPSNGNNGKTQGLKEKGAQSGDNVSDSALTQIKNRLRGS